MGMPPPLAVPPGAIPADLLPVDPCLPCHSHHFVNRRAQTAAGPTAAAAAAADQVTYCFAIFTSVVFTCVCLLTGLLKNYR